MIDALFRIGVVAFWALVGTELFAQEKGSTADGDSAQKFAYSGLQEVPLNPAELKTELARDPSLLPLSRQHIKRRWIA
ncbi:MAG: hypothetical protein QM811_14315 [Pirellulales bacterium]